ncbi:hypothetical protein CHLRE_08g371301v5 [Chlamydomonas reinhardtii]|uniref:Uncharacterized protein n=1 Tax=Chlamydomonas reinhardtii TaxID=3055 RepID=A0A2K3DH81_CHLRE|nr:uncharacterized protein CHLRE_08g371301v5 [Chlamydomonas reinhardtii]PNW79900.1 hypothetical protein CHLRE_08g371301v5 [Chlamydomonas reinhardtii]
MAGAAEAWPFVVRGGRGPPTPSSLALALAHPSPASALCLAPSLGHARRQKPAWRHGPSWPFTPEMLTATAAVRAGWWATTWHGNDGGGGGRAAGEAGAVSRKGLITIKPNFHKPSGIAAGGGGADGGGPASVSPSYLEHAAAAASGGSIAGAAAAAPPPAPARARDPQGTWADSDDAGRRLRYRRDCDRGRDRDRERRASYLGGPDGASTGDCAEPPTSTTAAAASVARLRFHKYAAVAAAAAAAARRAAFVAAVTAAASTHAFYDIKLDLGSEIPDRQVAALLVEHEMEGRRHGYLSLLYGFKWQGRVYMRNGEEVSPLDLVFSGWSHALPRAGALELMVAVLPPALCPWLANRHLHFNTARLMEERRAGGGGGGGGVLFI